MDRPDGRAFDSLRNVSAIENFVSCAEASVMIEIGKTRVLCNATVDDNIPRWLREKGGGWVTAEYSLLPRSTGVRVKRERGMVSGRTQEIQRLIGRSLRGVCNLKALGERTITIDCDVIEADGGTRTASVVGGFMSLVKAVRILFQDIPTEEPVIRHWLAATSVGIIKGQPVLDLCYQEDMAAEVDMNVIMTHTGEFVEIQGTGEEATYSRTMLNQLLDLAGKGCSELIDFQQKHLGDSLP
jgi:ribonuclease PH